MEKEEMRSTLPRCGSIISLRWMWDLCIYLVFGYCCWLMNYTFNYFFKGTKSLQLTSFYSRLGCLTLFIIKAFCTLLFFLKEHSINSIIYCRSLEFSRDNHKAKKVLFLCCLKSYSVILAQLQKIENRYSFFFLLLLLPAEFWQLVKIMPEHKYSYQNLVPHCCQQHTVHYWEGGRE